MKEQKRRIETYAFYDHTNIEKHLAEMAQKGWMLAKINRFTWKYHRVEPKVIHFAVTYYPQASEFDPKPLEGQLIYRDYSERCGWKFICSSAQMQIFYNEEANPVPMETDPVVEVGVIHQAAKRGYLPSYWLLFVLSIIQAALFISSLLGNPIRLLSSTTQLQTGFMWAWLFLLCIVELTGYYRWHYRALRSAENGEFLETRSHALFQKILLIAVILGLISIVINLFSIGDTLQVTIYVLLLAGVIAIVIIVCSVKDLLKKMKVSRTMNFTATLMIDFLLALALVVGVTYGILSTVHNKSDNSDNIVYQVESPLAVEDLTDASCSGYIKENRQSESVFLAQRALRQWARHDKNEADNIPELQYSVTIVKVPAVYNICKNRLVNKPRDKVDADGYLFVNHYEATDATHWQAKEAYQFHWRQGILNKYILCYPDRIIEIDFNWEPTEDQMHIVADKLANRE